MEISLFEMMVFKAKVNKQASDVGEGYKVKVTQKVISDVGVLVNQMLHG